MLNFITENYRQGLAYPIETKYSLVFYSEYEEYFSPHTLDLILKLNLIIML